MKTINELIAIKNEYILEKEQGIENIDFVSVLQENGLTTQEFAYQDGKYYLHS